MFLVRKDMRKYEYVLLPQSEFSTADQSGGLFWSKEFVLSVHVQVLQQGLLGGLCEESPGSAPIDTPQDTAEPFSPVVPWGKHI